MGFKIPSREATIIMSDEFEGAEAVCRLDVPLGMFLEMQDFENNMDVAFKKFGDEIVVSWNLETNEGEPIAPSGDGMKQLTVQLATQLIGDWGEQISNPTESVSE